MTAMCLPIQAFTTVAQDGTVRVGAVQTVHGGVAGLVVATGVLVTVTIAVEPGLQTTTTGRK